MTAHITSLSQQKTTQECLIISILMWSSLTSSTDVVLLLYYLISYLKVFLFPFLTFSPQLNNSFNPKIQAIQVMTIAGEDNLTLQPINFFQ